MDKYLKKVIALLLICILGIMAFSLAACSKNEEDAEPDENATVNEEGDPVPEDDPSMQDYDNGVTFEEEEEDAEITVKDADKADFFGKWEAKSGAAHYYYGKIEITVKEDGTWEGVITDENLSGTWEEQGQGLYLTSDIFNCTLNFSSSGNLMLKEVYEAGDVNDSAVIVLSKVE